MTPYPQPPAGFLTDFEGGFSLVQVNAEHVYPIVINLTGEVSCQMLKVHV